MENQTDTEEEKQSWTAFAGEKKLAEGGVLELATKIKRYLAKHPDGSSSLLIFNDATGQQVDWDLRGTPEEVVERMQGPSQSAKSGPGRPRLGVVSREIGLLPRHWDWLAEQPGGASVTLRKLVDEARRQNRSQDLSRQSQNAAYRFMSAMAGNLPHFEEASRAFFARNKPLFLTLTAAWPPDIREHVLRLGAQSFGDG